MDFHEITLEGKSCVWEGQRMFFSSIIQKENLESIFDQKTSSITCSVSLVI